MQEEEEESTSFDGSYILTFKSFEVSSKRKENILTFDKQQLESCRSTDSVKPFSSKSGCSKSCTYKKTSSNGYIWNLIICLRINW